MRLATWLQSSRPATRRVVHTLPRHIDADGEFVHDEDGQHQRSKRITDWCATSPGAGVEPEPMTAADVDNLAWQLEAQSRIDADYVHAVAEAEHASGGEYSYLDAAHVLGADAESIAALRAGSCSTGLVPVLSTGKVTRPPRPAARSFARSSRS